MKQGLLTVLLIATSSSVLAQGMSAQEIRCYSRTKDEADFIVSRIDLIHHSYEQKVQHSPLGRFRSGDYSTIHLLNNTIRKYHRRLVHHIKNYPFRYEARLKVRPNQKHTRCPAQALRNESVGTIHEFELSWQKALRQARKNARYFKQLNDMH